MDWHSSGQWLESPSGSGAEAPWPDEWSYHTQDNHSWNESSGDAFVSYPDEYDEEHTSASISYGASELPYGAVMSTKVPPSWDGRGSWFAFEELVYDWEDSCVLDKKLRGPALRNRLQGEAVIHKPLLDREKLKDETD